MADIQIYVAAHKKFTPSERLASIYRPLQVGSEGKEPLGFLRDNTGDHISEKNPSYCELTGLYWAWKNVQADVVGLCHYRRYFSSRPLDRKLRRVLTPEQIEKILSEYDIILPRRVHLGRKSVGEHYIANHFEKDLQTTRRALEELYPDYLASFDEVMAMHRTHQCNMFIMPKEKADAYCEWLFSVLAFVEAQTDISGYDPVQKRIFGYLGERLLHVWVHHQKLRVCEKWYASTELSAKTVCRALLDKVKG
ncbi:MAG: DUF4422 domain-containing protein [Clostridia bacterium]|nr:DUF4422 domain-containing protein [Clostridia bacterium]